MAKAKGTACVLFIDVGGPPAVPTLLDGQQNTRFNGSTNVAETTDKSNAGWETGEATTINGEITAEGQVNWGDTVFEAIRAAWEARTNVIGEIRFNAANDNYRGEFSVTGLEMGGETKGMVEYTITLTPVAALTGTFT